MKKTIFLILVFFASNSSFSQNLLFDDFSTFNLTKLDGQNGYSTSTPSLGNGTGGCFGPGCIFAKVISSNISYPNFGNATQALLCSDTTNLQTQDGPGKSLGSTITSGSVYLSVLINCYQQNGTGTNKQIVRLMDNSTNVPCRLFVKNASGGAVNFGISKTSSATTWSTSSYGTNQDHLIIIKYKYNSGSTTNDEVSIFIDPDLSLPEPAPSFSITGNTDATSITRMVFPWNSNSTVFNGIVGIASVSQSWSSIVPQAPSTFSIAGKIKTPNGLFVNNAIVSAKTTTTKDSVYSTVGSFTINNLTTNSYTIKPQKNNDINKTNGVKSSDLIIIQRHILNTASITNAYKLIAADVTGDGIINNTDILRIKRLILGTDTTFISNTRGRRLWEFVDSAFVFADSTNPFPFKDSITLNNLSSNQNNVNFTAIKLGDVVYDWNSTIAKTSLNKLKIIANKNDITTHKENNNIYYLPIKVKNFKNIAAFQYTLNFNYNKFKLLSINNNEAIQDIDFNTLLANKNGNIGVLWVDDKAISKSFNDNTTLFTLVLQANNSNVSNDDFNISLSNNLVEIDAFDNNTSRVEISLEQENDFISSNYINIQPNPTKNYIQLNLFSQNKYSTTINIYNSIGKLVLIQNQTLEPGKNNLKINVNHLPNGIYFIKDNKSLHSVRFIKE